MNYSICIVTRDSWSINQLIYNILECTSGNLQTIVIIDNNSSEDFREHLHDIEILYSKFGNLRVWYRKHNWLYSRSNNMGLDKMAKLTANTSDYYFIVNPDISFTEKYTSNRIDPFAELCSLGRWTEAGIVGATLLYPDGVTIEHAGGEENGHIGYRLPFTSYGKGSFIECEWVTGALFGISNETVHTLGMLDQETYTHWVSDQEYCRRASHFGIKTICSQDIAFIHNQGSSVDGKNSHQAILESTDIPNGIVPNIVPFSLEHIKETALRNSKNCPLRFAYHDDIR